MTVRAKAVISRFESEKFALRDKVVARLEKISANDRFKFMISAGVLTKKGKLSSTYKSGRLAKTH
jgi:hypothetical protein